MTNVAAATTTATNVAATTTTATNVAATAIFVSFVRKGNF